MARFLKLSRKSGIRKLQNVKRHQLSSRKSTACNKTRRTLNAWSEESMSNAIAEYTTAKQEGRECGLRHIARAYGIPRSTLERRVNGKVAGNKHASGRRTAFTQEEECELRDLLTSMARRGFPLRERERCVLWRLIMPIKTDCQYLVRASRNMLDTFGFGVSLIAIQS